MAASLPEGTLVEKVNSEPADGHRDGTRGNVLSAFGDGYLVEWEDEPGRPVLIRAGKLKVIRAPRKKKR